MAGLAAVVFLGANFYFRRTIIPGPALDYRTWSAALIGQCLPQATVLVSLMLLLQMVIAPLLLMSTALICLLYANNRKFLLLNEPLTPSDIVLTIRQIHSWPLLARYVRRSRYLIWVLPAALAVNVAALACEPWLLGQYWFSLALLSVVPMAIVFAPLRGKSLIVRLLDAWEVPFWDCDLPTSVAASGFLTTFVRCLDNVPRPAIRTLNEAGAETILAKKVRRQRRPLAAARPQAAHRRGAGRSVHGPAIDGPAGRSRPVDGLRRRRAAERVSRQLLGAGVRRMDGPLGVFASDGHQPGEFRQQRRQPEHDARAERNAFPAETSQVAGIPHDDHPPARPPLLRARQRLRVAGIRPIPRRARLRRGPREGLYVSDVAIAARIEEELRRAAEPTFLYCVTMENHGPWDDEVAPPTPPFSTEPRLSPEGHLSFAHYLRHLRSADSMIRRLTDMVIAAETPMLLLLVGDHLPSMTPLFREIAFPMFDPNAAWSATAPWLQTPYFLLSNTHSDRHQMDCDISFLPGLLLDCAGLNGDRFFHANSEMRRRLNGNIHSDADAMAREAYLRVCYEIAAFPDRYASTPRQ